VSDELRCAVCSVRLAERNALDAALRLGDPSAAHLHLRSSSSPDEKPRCLAHYDVKITPGPQLADHDWGNR
jgi:hypothetical protein